MRQLQEALLFTTLRRLEDNLNGTGFVARDAISMGFGLRSFQKYPAPERQVFNLPLAVSTGD